MSERTDTERLDWLERIGGEMELGSGDPRADIVFHACWHTTNATWINAPSLRAAIDAAMAKVSA